MKLTINNLILLLLLFSLVLLSACAQKPLESDTPETTAPPETSAEPVPETNLDDLQFVLEMPSKELQERFVNEYKAFMISEFSEYPTISKNYQKPNLIIEIDEWYGSFGDIHFLLINDGNLDHTCAIWTDYVADSVFTYSCGISIMVWVDGEFLPLKTAYIQNIITPNMVKTIANVYNHVQGEPIKVS